MFYKLLEREDVLDFIHEICTNKRYYLKKSQHLDMFCFSISNKLALFIFYDALYKYQILIDDIYLFEEYLSQLKKIYRKIDNFEDIRIGIHQLICKLLSTNLSIDDINNIEGKKKIVSYVYNKYIVEGYFIHGFAPGYYNYLESNPFIPEKYQNYYESFSKLDSIFKKYSGKSVISKDFSSDKVFFTDDFVMGCYHSIYAPMFFYEFLSNELFGGKIRNDLSYIYDYDKLVGPLKKYMSNNLFTEADRKIVLNIVKRQWIFLQQNGDKITLLLAPRNKILAKEILLDEYLKDNHTTYEVVDRILSTKYSSISSNLTLQYPDFQLISLDSYCERILEKEEDTEEVDIHDNVDILDKHGNVSILLLVGSLFVSLGVIITIISILRG